MTIVEPLVPLPDEPLLPATKSLPLPSRRGAAVALPTVRVNLLPPEVTVVRRAHRMRRVVLGVLAVLVLVLAAVSFLVRSGIGDARGELTAAEAVNATLRAQQGSYTAVVTAQGDLAAAVGRLADLSAADVGWAAVTRAIRAAAPAGVTVTGIDGTGATDPGATDPGATDPGATDPGAAGSVGGAPGGTGATGTASAAPPGRIVVAGTATAPAAVAGFLDALTGDPAFANVVATGVTALPSGGFGFGITADVTAAALSHRFDSTGGR